MRSLLLLPVFVLGCHAAAIDDRADARILDVRSHAEDAVLYPACGNGADFGARCGLVSKLTGTDRFRDLFRQKACATLDDAACQARFTRAIDGWLAQRYFAADWNAVTVACDSHPGRCDDPKAFELMLLDSHNALVRDREARDENAIEAQRATEHRADAEQTMAVVSDTLDFATAAIGDATYASHVGPKCRSYPSVLTGVTNTVCTR